MTEKIDVFYSFRSPYSYLASRDMLALARDYDIDVHLRVILPIAVRDPSFFEPGKLPWAKYILLDWERRAEFLGMPHVWPTPDPIDIDQNTRVINPDQPLIYWLSHLGVEAERRGCGIEFAAAVSGLIFGGTEGWDKGAHMADVLLPLGLSLTDMEGAIKSGTHADDIEANQKALTAVGHWGVPTFAFRGEPFFGQDRVELLRWTLDKSDIKRSTP